VHDVADGEHEVADVTPCAASRGGLSRFLCSRHNMRNRSMYAKQEEPRDAILPPPSSEGLTAEAGDGMDAGGRAKEERSSRTTHCSATASTARGFTARLANVSTGEMDRRRHVRALLAPLCVNSETSQGAPRIRAPAGQQDRTRRR
jgi:hypothetical protein